MSHVRGTGVRVILDLSYFFSDKRKKCYYFVDFIQNKTIGDICRKVKSNFSIPNAIWFEINGCYVPENEDVHVLYSEDVIKVIDHEEQPWFKEKFIEENVGEELRITVSSNNIGTRKSKRLDVEEESENNVAADVLKPKKRRKIKNVGIKGETFETEEVTAKHNVEIFSNIEDHVEDTYTKHFDKKQLCNVVVNNVDLNTDMKRATGMENKSKTKKFNNELNFTDTNDSNMLTIAVAESLKSDLELYEESVAVKNSPSLPTEETNSNTLKKEYLQKFNGESSLEECSPKKRIRHRRRKNNSKKSEPNYVPDQVPEIFTETVHSTVCNGYEKGPKHIKFSDDDKEDQDNCNPENVTNNLNKDLLFPLVEKTLPAHHEHKPLTSCNISENITSITGGPIVFECKKNRFHSNLTSAATSATEVAMDSNTWTSDNLFLKYPVLPSAPKANDIIAFKKWKMDANYCPGISDYISAKVMRVLKEDNMVHLKILNGHDEFKEPQGKFSLVEKEEEEDENEESNDIVVDEVDLNINDLLDVRLLYP